MRRVLSLSLIVTAGLACAPEPEATVTELVAAYKPLGLCKDGDNLYWTAIQVALFRSLMTAGAAGENPTIAIRAEAQSQNVVRVVAGGGHAYWASGSPPEMNRGSTLNDLPQGGESQLLVSGALPIDLALHGEHLYWAQAAFAVEDAPPGFDETTSIGRVPIGGGPAEPIVAMGGAEDLAVSDAFVAWITRAVDFDGANYHHDIMLTALDSLETTVLATEQVNTVDIAIDDTSVYWTTEGTQWGLDFPKDGTVMAAPIAGGAPRLLAGGLDRGCAIALDDAWVYFTECWGGRVAKVNKSGGPVVTLAAEQDHPNGVAIDDTYVYWSNLGLSDHGSINRVFKEPSR